MTNIELEIELKKSYEVVCCVDLADITKSPDKIYQILNQYHKTTFNPLERLVFYSQYTPSKELISHIVKAALLIDISNSFILICCNEDIASTVTEVCNSLGFINDVISTQQIKIKSSPLEQNYNLPNTICPIPWTSIEVRNNGNIFPCCMHNKVVGNIDDGISETFLNNKMDALRKEFLDGVRPTGCSPCWRREDKNLISNRIRHTNYMLKDLLIAGFDKPIIQNLDLKFGTTCNFKCRICSSGDSSSFAEEEAKFKNIPFTLPKNWAEDPKNLLQIEELLPTLTNIDMYGGEPFLLKSFTKVLDLAIKKDYAKNIRLHYNTNGSIFPTHLVEYWKHFRYIDIYFSIDNIGKRFEFERGGSWEKVEQNILKIKNLNLPNCEINIMPSINVMNVYYFDDIYKWALKHNFGIKLQHVVHPAAMSLMSLTQQAKDMITEKYQNHPWPEMQKILANIKETPASNGVEFIKLTKHFDSLRQENFAETHSEIAIAMGYSVQY